MSVEKAHSPWDGWVALFLHPIKVAIIEAFIWIDEPLSPKLLDESLDQEDGVPLIAYHVRTLADAGVIERVDQTIDRGNLQTFYRLVTRAASV